MMVTAERLIDSVLGESSDPEALAKKWRATNAARSGDPDDPQGSAVTLSFRNELDARGFADEVDRKTSASVFYVGKPGRVWMVKLEDPKGLRANPWAGR